MGKLKTAVGIAALVATLFGGLFVSSPAGADTSRTHVHNTNCTLWARGPLFVALDSLGYKTSAGVADVYCASPARRVLVQLELRADDDSPSFSSIVNDALLASRTYDSGSRLVGSAGVRVTTYRARCNEDNGLDELYSRARFSVMADGGSWTPYSGWHRLPYTQFNCAS